MTKIPYDGSDNDRLRDAVDLLLLKDLLVTEVAQSVGLSITSIDDAESELRALLDSIVNATST